MAPPFMFPSSLRDLEQDNDGDGDEEPSLRPQNPVAVATLRTDDLEEYIKGRRQWLPWLADHTSRQKARGSEEEMTGCRGTDPPTICLSQIPSRPCRLPTTGSRPKPQARRLLRGWRGRRRPQLRIVLADGLSRAVAGSPFAVGR